ncbi:MAG: sodium ion-translocating decarboxylase subunit beta [Bacilli bacterium]|nr:sodium ion-translocating decarboxylase subunit beta [Bacilli bacterium]
MILVAILLLYLAIFKKAEPYLLIPIAFGMLLVNLPESDVYLKQVANADTVFTASAFADYVGISVEQAKLLFTSIGFDPEAAYALKSIVAELVNNGAWVEGAQTSLTSIGLTEAQQLNIFKVFTTYEYKGLLGVIYLGVKYEIYPCLIFLGIGATTDFGPLIANPKSMILGAAAQIGIFVTFMGALLLGFNGAEAASIGIIGGADGPTAILTTTKLAPDLLPAISVAAYSYMALVPFIQPPIIRLLTTKEERKIKMKQLREVSKTEKIIFPILVTAVVVLLIPSCAPLVGMLMLGNLIKESGVVPKLCEIAGNSLLYIVTILLGICVGATASADNFLSTKTLMIFGLGIIAFSFATAAGVLFGKIMCKLTKGKINPMIGAAGVSAVPMAARVVHKEGVKEDPTNFLLMHAMGPNVAGVIGSAVAAGLLINFFG